MIQQNQTETEDNYNSPLGLSYTPYYKNREKVSKNPDYNSIVAKKDKQYFEYAIGGSYARVVNSRIDPHTTESKRVVDWIRGNITYFSQRSRKRLLELVSKIDKGWINPESVLFITLTAPAMGWRDVPGHKWKARLNNFLTQLRQKYGAKGLCGIWRLEFQRRGAPHFHLVTYNTFICKDWVAEKWNTICGINLSFKEKQKHLQAGTQVAIAREWNAINDYFSKTMAYVAKKSENWRIKDESVLDWMKSFGKHWGVIGRDMIKEMTHIVVREFSSAKQFYQVRRFIKSYVVSAKKKKLGEYYNHKVGKVLDKLFSMKDKCKHMAFIPYNIFEKILALVGIKVESNNSHGIDANYHQGKSPNNQSGSKESLKLTLLVS